MPLLDVELADVPLVQGGITPNSAGAQTIRRIPVRGTAYGVDLTMCCATVVDRYILALKTVISDAAILVSSPELFDRSDERAAASLAKSKVFATWTLPRRSVQGSAISSGLVDSMLANNLEETPELKQLFDGVARYDAKNLVPVSMVVRQDANSCLFASEDAMGNQFEVEGPPDFALAIARLWLGNPGGIHADRIQKRLLDFIPERARSRRGGGHVIAGLDLN